MINMNYPLLYDRLQVWGQWEFKEINIFIQQGCIKMISSEKLKTFIMLQKISILNKC